MATRRALIVAPLYDGKWLPPLLGSDTLIKRLVPILEGPGRYDVKVADRVIASRHFRRSMRELFDSEGELLFYFYGHGCVRAPGLGVLGTSDAQPDDEGVLMSEVSSFAQRSRAKEVVLVFDCCHAGATVAVNSQSLNKEARGFIEQPGRAILAACAEHQQGWEAKNDDGRMLGAFSTLVLDGIRGKARMHGRDRVRASSLGNYVTDEFRSWKQDPICLTHETGERSCIITFGATEPRRSRSKQIAKRPKGLKGGVQQPLRIGLPFKPSTNFVGRSAEVDYLRSVIMGGEKPIAVSATVEGLGGIGKTELVLQLLYDPEISDIFATIVWLDGSGPMQSQWERVARELDIEKVPLAQQGLIAKVGKTLHKRGPGLIVLDNATDWSPLAEMIPPGFPLLVTTRTRDFGGSSFRHSELGILSDDAAVDFLTRLSPSIKDDPALPHLIRLLSGHALALEIAGYHIKDLCSPQEYVRRLVQHQAEFSSQAVEKTHYQGTIESCLAISWDSLKDDASRLLWKKASLFAPTSAHRDLLRASFIGGNSREIRYLIKEYREASGSSDSSSIVGDATEFDVAYAELRGCHILSRVEGYNGERWAMHRLVRDFARRRLQKHEVMVHAVSLADWLRDPELPLAPEIPHFVAAILDSAGESTPFYDRYAAREIWSRGYRGFSSESIVHYISDQLNDPKALTLILAGLTDINDDVRIASIRLLENIGPIPEVIEGLAAALDDPQPEVRNQAATTLAKHGGERTVEILREAVEGPNRRARLTAVRALGLMGKKAHVVLIDALKSDDETVLVEAATLLCEQGREEGASVVLGSLSGANEDDLVRLIHALKSLKKASVIRDFCKHSRQLLESQNVRVRLATVQALSHIGKPAHSALIDALHNNNEQVRTEVALSLCEQGRKEGIDTLLVLLSLANESTFEKLTKALAQLTGKSEKEKFEVELIGLLGSSNTDIRLKAAILLFKRNRKEGLHVVLDSISGISEREIEPYLDMLASINDQIVQTVFLKHLKSTDFRYRRAAAKYFRRVQVFDALPTLIELLNDEDPIVRRETARALGSTGDPKLRTKLGRIAAQDSDVEVRRAANYALGQLRKTKK